MTHAPSPSPPGAPRAAPHTAVFCASLGGFIDLYCTQAISPALQARFALSVADAGALVTTTTLTLALVAPLANALSRRLGARRATLLGLSGLTISVALMSLAQQTGPLMLLRILQGLFIPVVLASVLRSTPPGLPPRQALALAATYVSGAVLGGVLGRLLPALAVPVLGWGLAMLAFAAVQGLLLAIVAWQLPQPATTPPGSAPAVPSEAGTPALRHVAGLGLAGFSLLFAQAAVYTYIAIRLAAPPHGWTTPQLGALYLVFLPSLVFVHATQPLSARLGGTRTRVAASVTSLGGLGFTLWANDALVLTGLVLFSVGVFVCQAVLAQQVSAAEQRIARLPVAGIYLSCYYLGASAGALAPAAWWDAAGWPGCVTLVVGVQLATSVVRKLLKLHSPHGAA